LWGGNIREERRKMRREGEEEKEIRVVELMWRITRKGERLVSPDVPPVPLPQPPIGSSVPVSSPAVMIDISVVNLF
jgi:hypothetical protein